jgi:hypothetical protein
MHVTDKSSKKAPAFLQSEHQDLKSLFGKIQLITELNTALKPCLDENLRDYCQVANLLGDKLILLAANGSIATQIRFQTIDLLRKFKQNPTLASIRSIQCKVRPTEMPPASKVTANKMQGLSAETANLVQDIAKSLSDPRLREIMEKIAKHRK